MDITVLRRIVPLTDQIRTAAVEIERLLVESPASLEGEIEAVTIESSIRESVETGRAALRRLVAKLDEELGPWHRAEVAGAEPRSTSLELISEEEFAKLSLHTLSELPRERKRQYFQVAEQMLADVGISRLPTPVRSRVYFMVLAVLRCHCERDRIEGWYPKGPVPDMEEIELIDFRQRFRRQVVSWISDNYAGRKGRYDLSRYIVRVLGSLQTPASPREISRRICELGRNTNSRAVVQSLRTPLRGIHNCEDDIGTGTEIQASVLGREVYQDLCARHPAKMGVTE